MKKKMESKECTGNNPEQDIKVNSSISEESSNIQIKEGKATILTESNNVFYNPVQEFNRDLSIAVLSVFAEERIRSKKLKKRKADGEIREASEEGVKLEVGVPHEDGLVILDALSATGLRAVRFALEVPGLKEVVANDISQAAVEAIKVNLRHNKVTGLVKTNFGDASLLMHSSPKKFDAVDLDPYGCPARFLDSAVQSVQDGGLLLVTCTDMAVLAGNSPETCYVKYGSISLKSPACHEMALRIALRCIESHANRYGRYIVPVASFSVDFYIRLIVKVFTSPATCKETTSKLSHVYQCVGCKSFSLEPLGTLVRRDKGPPRFALPRLSPTAASCQHCRSPVIVGGPIWSAPLQDVQFLRKVQRQTEEASTAYRTCRRISGLLSLLQAEIEAPLYYPLNAVCSRLHSTTIPLRTFRSALLNAGYAVSESHACPNAVKTDAPASFVWDIMREWVKKHPVSSKRCKEPVTEALLSSERASGREVDLSSHPGGEPPLSGAVLRYQTNPQPHWGPGFRATSNVLSVVEEKRKTKLERRPANRKLEPGVAVERPQPLASDT